MKKLNKLGINSQKLMNSEELLALRGGTEVVRCNPEDPGQIPCFCDFIFAGCQISAEACLDRCDLS